MVAEGDSISVDSPGYYTGAYRLANPGLTYKVKAVGGSDIPRLVARREAVLAERPDIVTVFIGANDLGSYPSGRAYFDALMAYIQPYRDNNIKVLIGTPLPRCANDNQSFNNNHNRIRPELADLLKAAVGSQIAGVFDFGGDPVIGNISACTNAQLFPDGLHPSGLVWNDAPGGHAYMLPIYQAAMRPVVESVRGQ